VSRFLYHLHGANSAKHLLAIYSFQTPSQPLPNPFPSPSKSPWPPPVAAPLKMQVVRPVGSDGLLAKELGHVSLARFAFT